MPADAGLRFRALQDLLANQQRQIQELQRQVASGVVVDGELRMIATPSSNIVFDGPTQGLNSDIYRHNQFAHIAGGGVLVSVGGSGAWNLRLPFTVTSASPLYVRCGTWDAHNTTSGLNYQGALFGVTGSAWLLPVFKSTFTAEYQVVTSTAPFTWGAGDIFRFEGSFRIKSGA